MIAVAGMAAASIVSWLVAAALVDPGIRLDLLLGMLGPLFAVTGSSVLVERTYRVRPQAVTTVMIAAFAFKLVFFGAYVAAVLRLMAPRPLAGSQMALVNDSTSSSARVAGSGVS